MKKNLSALELKYIVQELQDLIGAKVVKVFQPHKKEFYLQLHSSQVGKKLVRILVPNFIYLTEYRPQSPLRMPGFCQLLRKRLGQARVREITQPKMERIVEFVFETKEGNYRLITELFTKGNMVLCKDDQIVSALEIQKFRDREIKSKQAYEYPKQTVDLTDFKFEDMQQLLQTNTKTIVTFLATDLGLGGLYAEELCARSQLNKNSTTLAKKEIERLYKNITLLLQAKPKANIVYLGNEVVDILPFELESYEKNKKEFLSSYSEALSRALTATLKQEPVIDRQREKHKTILKLQSDRIKEMEKAIAENQRKGELIYEHYQEIKGLLDNINADLKKLSKEELQEKYKRQVKEIDLKTKTVVIDIK